MKEHISKMVASRRKALGLTQEQLGEKLCVSGQAVSKWECGDSMPDILTLPSLCAVLGISVEELLGVSEEQKEERILRDFVMLAAKKGRSELLLEASARLFSDGGKRPTASCVSISKEELRVWLDLSEGGAAFTAKDYHEGAFTCGSENPAHYLCILGDHRALEVLKLTSPYDAVTSEEICAATGYDEGDVTAILLALMQRNMVAFDADCRGKRGYLQAGGIIGVYMALLGARAAGCGGDNLMPGNLWFRHVPDGEK